ncbi:MAG: response regulator [Bdellovibrionales bacterium]|nr:response regulator [Bdellovibrionales bacterium]
MSHYILIADDDPVVLHILGSILAVGGHEVLRVDSGQGCLEQLARDKEQNKLPSILFLDNLLGDITGLEVLAKLRESFGEDLMPIVLLSANTKAEMSDYDVDVLPEYFLEKPFTSETVNSVIAQILGT